MGQGLPERQWPAYRGYMSSGVLDNVNLPDSFDISGMFNVRWKTEVPGLGISSPVIWDSKLFITTAVSGNDKFGFKPGIYGDGVSVGDSSVHEWKVLCYEKSTGKLLWSKTSHRGIPAIKRHPKSTHANPSVATDGRHVVAFFGSEGLYCYSMNGDLLWKKDFGVLKAVAFDYPSAEWEFASSPIIYKNVVVVQCDVLENSFIAAFDADSGMTIPAGALRIFIYTMESPALLLTASAIAADMTLIREGRYGGFQEGVMCPFQPLYLGMILYTLIARMGRIHLYLL